MTDYIVPNIAVRVTAETEESARQSFNNWLQSNGIAFSDIEVGLPNYLEFVHVFKPGEEGYEPERRSRFRETCRALYAGLRDTVRRTCTAARS